MGKDSHVKGPGTLRGLLPFGERDGDDLANGQVKNVPRQGHRK